LSADKVDRRRQSALTKAEALPKEMLVALTADEASRVAGAPIWGGSLYFPQGGWLNPASLCTSLVDGVDIRLDTAVSDISFQDGEWHVADSAGTNFAIADIIIVANGAEAYRFSEVAALPLEAFRGQITYLPETKLSANLENVVTFGNYITPSYQGQHIVGATYQPLPIDAASKSQEVRTTDNLRNITALRDHLPELAYGSDSAPKSGRVSVRCTTPDHNPVVGAMPDVHFYEVAYEGIRQGQLRRYPAARYVPGLYVHLGLGSRGLTTALLSAELIASQVAGDPLPLERSLVELVHPGRFFMRALRYDRQLIPAP
jgi:tRNA 5-methylaminomethyl-2-thiouridine biosynthesis bifunctional protein